MKNEKSGLGLFVLVIMAIIVLVAIVLCVQHFVGNKDETSEVPVAAQQADESAATNTSFAVTGSVKAEFGQ